MGRDMARFGLRQNTGLRCAGGTADPEDCACCAPFMLGRRGVLAGAGALLASGVSAQSQAPVREITQIGGNLYRFRNNFHFSVFVVTPSGIIATDPINADAAGWLKAQFKERFNATARYVVYSHDHADHISGGEVFADTATFVGHENAREVILGEKRPMPAPTITFAERLRLELGGSVVDIRYVGRNHSNNSVVMLFPAARALFAVDFIPVEALGFRDWPDAYLEEWITSLKRVEAMDFDILAPGHGALGRHAHVGQFRGYMEEMYGLVLAGVRAGKTVEELQAVITMDKYKSWAGYEQMRALNVAGIHRLVQANRRSNRDDSGGTGG